MVEVDRRLTAHRNSRRNSWIGWGLGLWLFAVTPSVTLLAGSLSGCSKSGPRAPVAPKMPEGWKVLEEAAPSAGDELFQKVQARFPGKIKTLRVIAYGVHGRHIVFNQIEASSPLDGDMIYRILARKKPMWAYWRRGQIIYEFRGPVEARSDIQAAHDLLEKLGN